MKCYTHTDSEAVAVCVHCGSALQHLCHALSEREIGSLSGVCRGQSSNPVPKPDDFWRYFAVALLALMTIPFLISILGLLAAIAIPNFVKARHIALAHQREQAARAVLPSGLAALWSGEGNANDSVGGNNGSSAIGISDAPGVVGQAFKFDGCRLDGTGDIPVPASPGLDIGKGSGITIECWIKPDHLGPIGAEGIPIVEWDSPSPKARDFGLNKVSSFTRVSKVPWALATGWNPSRV